MRKGSGICWCGAAIWVPNGEDERVLIAAPLGRPVREQHEPAECPAQHEAFSDKEVRAVLEAEEAVRAYRKRKKRRALA